MPIHNEYNCANMSVMTSQTSYAKPDATAGSLEPSNYKKVLKVSLQRAYGFIIEQ